MDNKPYDILDEDIEDCIEFDSLLITKSEFEVILGWDKCCKCHGPFQFVDGHKYVRNPDGSQPKELPVKCVDCVEEEEGDEDKSMIEILRELNHKLLNDVPF